MNWVEGGIKELIRTCEKHKFGFSSGAFQAKIMHLELIDIKSKIDGAKNEQQYLNAIAEAERYILKVKEELEND